MVLMLFKEQILVLWLKNNEFLGKRCRRLAIRFLQNSIDRTGTKTYGQVCVRV
jgi:hypothetical protein